MSPIPLYPTPGRFISSLIIPFHSSSSPSSLSHRPIAIPPHLHSHPDPSSLFHSPRSICPTPSSPSYLTSIPSSHSYPSSSRPHPVSSPSHSIQFIPLHLIPSHLCHHPYPISLPSQLIPSHPVYPNPFFLSHLTIPVYPIPLHFVPVHPMPTLSQQATRRRQASLAPPGPATTPSATSAAAPHRRHPR